MTLSLYFAWIALVCTYECIREVGHDTLYIVYCSSIEMDAHHWAKG